MRAKLLLAAALLVSAMQPVLAQDLTHQVYYTLYPQHHGLLGGLFGRRACAAPIAATILTAPVCMEQPAVIANTGCGAAILTRDPMDLDIRRERLQEKINYLAGVGAINACRLTELNASMAEVGQAELAMRSRGDLSNWEARRLYRAMDKIGSRTDYWAHRGIGLGAWIGLGPGIWY